VPCIVYLQPTPPDIIARTHIPNICKDWKLYLPHLYLFAPICSYLHRVGRCYLDAMIIIMRHNGVDSKIITLTVAQEMVSTILEHTLCISKTDEELRIVTLI